VSSVAPCNLVRPAGDVTEDPAHDGGADNGELEGWVGQ
jgi:hypothetical protein